MINVFLTKALASRLNLSTGNARPLENNPMYSWMGHIIPLEGQEYALFINQASLFTVIVKLEPSIDVWQAFKSQIASNLHHLHLEAPIIERYLDSFDEITILKLKDKKLLARVNVVTAKAKGSILKILKTTLPMSFAETQVNSAKYNRSKKGCDCPT
ncbi:MAG: hypothetical protein A2487_15475 [Candidatus Raymondbacteria bacterium RifOxyC12_full_50_8]|uniref:DUF6933 domain-containing protein n=1 Tax=Candidatus Raymondbacteria bacterium RIFOXYD12_FULL_49_13 TaxID=1817890 RepID=A0A1F7FA83_UNCRA|nr:MAG: hypothetical protein A2248_22420 [Candidatus Raymondbacteria bacterium RIFOXYA2_FULL_49_16]OGJ93992.1 MAG: hypothetical protein A2350_19500 [Candidatus Raymondbacteria bacterium RifOxyB12_full_50_8]OGJ94623.1 MAG: hypothetical protein A2487_15475 [Candidatus Raymondbacteria bacterium RifOxyC12_full_50_8]OGK03521.1 MAG: hypothetical protein A2519_09815 [Candidatus Raymondbacteria bacterium RIFOXYD12_FULL_49_13]OGP42806.1 MAG: hypothetical protein A2324_15985 [Candidatus Raymondbacteria b